MAEPIRMPGKIELYWTTEDVASRLHVSKGTVKRWTGSGRLKKVKAGDKTLITESAIQDFIQVCTAAAEGSVDRANV